MAALLDASSSGAAACGGSDNATALAHAGRRRGGRFARRELLRCGRLRRLGQRGLPLRAPGADAVGASLDASSSGAGACGGSDNATALAHAARSGRGSPTVVSVARRPRFAAANRRRPGGGFAGEGYNPAPAQNKETP